MGVLKNDVGRPSNKTIRTRFILKLIGLILVVGLAFFVGDKLYGEKEEVKENTKVDKLSLEDIIKAYSSDEFDDKYSLIDMNGDKIEELIYYDQTDDISFNLYVYNGIKNGYTLGKKYEKQAITISNVMKTKEEDCLLVYSVHMGVEFIDRLYFKDGKIKVTEYEHEVPYGEQYLIDSYKDTLVWKYTSELNKKEVDIKEVFDKFVKNNNMTLHEAGKGYDAEALKAMNCITATMATADEFGIEILEFTDNTAAKKEFENQKEYQKTAGDDVIQIFDRKILNDKSTSYYDIFEISSITEDIEGFDKKVYSYHYMVRIDNYYISLGSSNYKDFSNDMTKLKEELNSLLGIK